MTTEQDIENIEIQRKDAEDMVAIAKAMQRLQSNRDFKKVIVEGYCKNEATRLVALRGDPNFQGADKQEALLKSIDAIGVFQQFMRGQIQLGDMAARAIEDCDEALEQLREEA